MVETINPISPKTNIPIADTLLIVKYSFFVGLLSTRQTRKLCKKNDFIFLCIFVSKKAGLKN